VIIRKRVKRRRNFYQRHRFLVLLTLGAIACLSAFYVSRALRSRDAAITQRPQPLPKKPEVVQNEQAARYDWIVYPYSIIPGGVRSRGELTADMESDPVVAAHFSDFDLTKARIIKAGETKFAHVSYRMRNKVYWTKKALKIPKGETLITDGTITARTRCGNQVSATPQEPVAEQEPVVETFDIPHLVSLDRPELSGSGMELGEIPSLSAFQALQHPEILPYYFRPLFVVRPRVEVPEPGTLGMLALGIAAVAAIRFMRRK
jgi:hypothetical protein